MPVSSLLSNFSLMTWTDASHRHRQHAALPYVEIGNSVEVCLISSRETGRWVIPKGWPKPNMEPHDLASREACEEAGLEGAVSAVSLGSYDYHKRLHYFFSVPCTVDVYALRVERQRVDWPEREWRTLRWLSLAEAASMVREEGLARIIAGFRGN